jgi:hypothetical protein
MLTPATPIANFVNKNQTFKLMSLNFRKFKNIIMNYLF